MAGAGAAMMVRLEIDGQSKALEITLTANDAWSDSALALNPEYLTLRRISEANIEVAMLEDLCWDVNSLD